MKKIFLILAACLVIVSCKKHTEDIEVATPMVTVSFTQQLVSSNSMVRSTTNEFLDIIEEQTPKYVNVTLKNLDLDKTYTCKSNESITIPVGNYNISGYIDGKYVYNMMYSSPSLNSTIVNLNIDSNTKVITLNVHYNCFAVFALIDECSNCTYTYGGGTTFNKFGKYYVGYFKNNSDETSANIKLTPYSDSTEFISTTYTFSTVYDKDKIYAEYGKYYVIHPQKVDKTTSSFELVLPDMIEGDI